MKQQELQNFLYDKIPIARALGARVVHSNSASTEISAPLAPNVNHVGTVFGGSLNSILVLACYSWLFNFLEDNHLHGHVILKSVEIKYSQPVAGDFSAVCSTPDSAKVDRFRKMLKRKGKSQITLEAVIHHRGTGACSFKGRFAVVPH